MKRLGIDLRLLNQTGVGTYLRNLLRYLPYNEIAEHAIGLTLFVRSDDRVQLQTFLSTHAGKTAQIDLLTADQRWHSFAEQLSFYDLVAGQRLDLMHFPYFGYPIRYRKPFVATVHDVTPLLFPTGKASQLPPPIYLLKQMTFRYVVAQQITNAVQVITPTCTVKKQIEDRYFAGVDQSKITAIYEGIDEEILAANPQQSVTPVDTEPYFLYVGNFYPHKNLSILIEAAQVLPHGYRVLLAGPDDAFTQQTRSMIERAGLKDRIQIISQPTRAKLIELYRNAYAFVHPSRSEGFGLPVLEAQHFGIPLILADIPVFHELVGANAAFFDPADSSSLGKILQHTAEDRSHIPVAPVDPRFSFQEMATETFSIYRRFL